MIRHILVSFFLFSNATWGAETTLVSPDSVAPFLSTLITFDEKPFTRLQGAPTGDVIKTHGAQFAEGFSGQYFRFERYSDVTGTTTFAPLTLNPDMTVQSFDGGRARSQDYNLTPVMIGSNNPALAGFYYRRVKVKRIVYSGLQKDTAPTTSFSTITQKMFGTGAVSILFDVDQRMVSLDLVRLSQPLPDNERLDPTVKNDTIFIKLFRRDGTFIDEQRLMNWPSGPVAIQRCYKIRDIAGIQITSNLRLGLAIDDLRFDIKTPNEQDENKYQTKPCPGLNS